VGPCFGARRQHDIRAASRRRIFDVASVTLRENVALMRHPATTCSAVEWRRQGGAVAGQGRASEAVTGCGAVVIPQTCIGRDSAGPAEPCSLQQNGRPRCVATRALPHSGPPWGRQRGLEVRTLILPSNMPAQLHVTAVCRSVNEAAGGAKVAAHSTDALSLLPDTAEACCCLVTKGCHHVLPATIRTQVWPPRRQQRRRTQAPRRC
jgi:hypothetical protein